MKAYWRSGGIAPHILDLGTRWRWVVSFTPPATLPPGKAKSPWYTHWIGGWVGPKAGLDAVVKRKTFPASAGTRTPDHPARVPVLYHWAISAMKAYWGVEVLLHTLTPALHLCEWLISLPGRFTPREAAPATHWTGGCVVHRTGPDTVAKKNKSLHHPFQESNPR
jgi:hypothetical protein